MQGILQKQKKLLPDTSDWIKRYNYKFATEQLEHNLVKAIIGPRRVGKSVLGLQMLAGKKFGYVNFDDPDVLNAFTTFADLTESIQKIYGKTDFLNFDEIQNLPQWELYVNSLHREGYNIVLTGSNANLLSSELATHLTGRVIEIELLPFALEEAKQVKPEISISEYILRGSYPEVLTKQIEPELYYRSLFQTSIVKDIITRYGIRNPLELEKLATYCLSTLTNLYSYQSLAAKLNMSVPTVSNYIGYLKESLLFFELSKFSNKSSEIIRSNKKLYCVDFAFSTFVGTSGSKNLGFAYENAVFITLKRLGFKPNKDLFYTENNSQEIDFMLIKPDGKKVYLQVAYNLEDNKTLARELSALDGLEGEKIIVTEHFGEITTSDVQQVSFAQLESVIK